MTRTLHRTVVLMLATLVALLAGTATASAHVSVSSADAGPGGYGKVTFRVPDESDTASTTSLRIQLPPDTPLSSVRAQPVAGWTVALTRTELDPPVEVAGETVSEAVTVVQFTAPPGGGIAPGEFQEFALSGGPFPETDSLVFAVVQTYSDGSESAWIEPTVQGQPEPAYPAPVLSLTGPTEVDGAHGAGTEDGAASDPTPTAATAATAPTATTSGTGGDGLAVTALVLGGLGLLAGVAGLVLGLGARRRTVDR